MRRCVLGLLVAMLPGWALAAPLDLLGFFEGQSVSAGETRTFGLFRERFTAQFEGRRERGTLVLDERFRFPDGPRLQRWRLRERDGMIGGTVETEGSDGTLHAPVPVTVSREGEGVVLDYVGTAPGGDRLLRFRHAITPNGDGTLGNDVSVRLWGLPVARSHVTFAKTQDALARHAEP